MERASDRENEREKAREREGVRGILVEANGLLE